MKNELSVAVLILLLIAGCSSKEEFPDVNYIQDSKEEKLELPDHPDAVSIKMDFIKIIDPTSPQLKENVNAEIDSFLLSNFYESGQFESIDQMKDTLFAEYKELIKLADEIPYGYEVERTVRAETDTLGIFSLSKFEMTFLGGAHPNSFTSFLNYDTKSGKRIELGDIIKKLIDLTKTGEVIFRAKKSLKANEDLQQAGYWFKNGQFKLNDNFLIKPDGLMFYYNPYEIASYADGVTELFIPYKKIGSNIKEEGPLTRFID